MPVEIFYLIATACFLCAFFATWGQHRLLFKIWRAAGIALAWTLALCAVLASLSIPSIWSKDIALIALALGEIALQSGWLTAGPCGAGLLCGLLCTRKKSPSETYAEANDRLMAQGLRENGLPERRKSPRPPAAKP